MPMRCGCSGSVTAVKPRAALRRISAAPSSASARNVMPIGTMRSGWGEYHSSKNQSFHARVTASPSSGSVHRENTEPQKPVICDGKFTDAHTPLMSMSRTRAFDLVATGAHLVEARRLDQPVLGLAADDRVEADLEEDLAVELPDLVALVGLDDARRQRLEPRGQAAVEHVRRLDEVVVDRDRACSGSGAARDRGAVRASRSCASAGGSCRRRPRRQCSSARELDRRRPAVVRCDLAFRAGRAHDDLLEPAHDQRDVAGLDTRRISSS